MQKTYNASQKLLTTCKNVKSRTFIFKGWGTRKINATPIVYRVIVLYNEARAVCALSFGLLRWLSRQRLNCWEIDNRVGYATETANSMICEWFAGPHGDDTMLYLAYIFFAQNFRLWKNFHSANFTPFHEMVYT